MLLFPPVLLCTKFLDKEIFENKLYMKYKLEELLEAEFQLQFIKQNCTETFQKFIIRTLTTMKSDKIKL